MSVLSTMHSHCTYCDGDNTPAEMAKAAYKLGFVSYGFSCHSYLPYPNDYAISLENEPKYREDVLKLKEQYSGKMEILLGLELDADTPYPDYKYDFLISSVHQLKAKDKFFAVDLTRQEFEECIVSFGGIGNLMQAFFDATVTAALRDNIDIVGHLDLISKFNENREYFDPDADWYKKMVFNAIDTILDKRHDIVFEVNTGAISRGYRTEPYPATTFLKYLAQKNARVMLNSDTHAVNTIDYAYDKGIDYCKKAGLNEICRLRSNGFEKISI